MTYGKTRLRILRTMVTLASILVATMGSCDSGSAKIHERFELTSAEFDAKIASLPDEIRDTIADRRWYFLELLDEVIDADMASIILVDKNHGLPRNYAPEDLVPLRNYDVVIGKSTLEVSRSIMPDLLSMVEAARIENIELPISSTYRSYNYQADLYARNVAANGVEQADRESAKPGHSQHQLGTTLDFGTIDDDFGDTVAGKWLAENAWRYGFSMSYPQGYEDLTGYRHEIWHYRHIGRPATLLEREFFLSVQQYLLEFLDAHAPSLRISRVAADR